MKLKKDVPTSLIGRIQESKPSEIAGLLDGLFLTEEIVAYNVYNGKYEKHYEIKVNGPKDWIATITYEQQVEDE